MCSTEMIFASEVQFSIYISFNNFYIYYSTPTSYHKTIRVVLFITISGKLYACSICSIICTMWHSINMFKVLCQVHNRTMILFQYIHWLCDTLLLLMIVQLLSIITIYLNFHFKHQTFPQLKNLLRRTILSQQNNCKNY